MAPRLKDLITVEPLAFIFPFGQFLSFPINSALIYEKSCLRNYDETFCSDMHNKTFQKEHKDEDDVIQSTASYWTMMNQVALAVPSTICVFFFIASWGDKVDRKIPILSACLGGLLCSAINFLSSYFMSWHIGLILVASAINGVFGAYTVFLMAIYTYIVHVSSPERKTVRVGIVESMSYMSSGVSVFVSGLIRREVKFTGVYIIVMAISAFSTLYTIFFIKSIKPPPKEKSSISKNGSADAWCGGTVSGMVAFIKKKRQGNVTLYIWIYILLLNLMQLGTSGELDILYIYLRRAPRSFNSVLYGYFKGTENFSRSLSLIVLLPILKIVFKLRETTILMMGVVFKGIQFLMLGLARTVVLIFIVLIFATLQGFPAAVLRSGMSKLVDKDENGRLFGIVAITEGLVSLAASFLFNGLYPETLDFFDGLMFEMIAVISIFAFIIALYLRVKKADLIDIESDEDKQDSKENPDQEFTPRDNTRL